MSHEDTPEAAVQLVGASLFDITGPIHVNYTTSSIAGKPQLSYKDAELDLSFEGEEEITRIQTSLGEVVTVRLEYRVDTFVRTFTLVVPAIRLLRGGTAKFDTLGIATTDRTSAFAPPSPKAMQTYEVHQLHGTAQTAET